MEASCLSTIGELHPMQLNKLFKILKTAEFFESAYYNRELLHLPHIHYIFKMGHRFQACGATTGLSGRYRKRYGPGVWRLQITCKRYNHNCRKSVPKVRFTMEWCFPSYIPICCQRKGCKSFKYWSMAALMAENYYHCRY